MNSAAKSNLKLNKVIHIQIYVENKILINFHIKLYYYIIIIFYATINDNRLSKQFY